MWTRRWGRRVEPWGRLAAGRLRGSPSHGCSPPVGSSSSWTSPPSDSIRSACGFSRVCSSSRRERTTRPRSPASNTPTTWRRGRSGAFDEQDGGVLPAGTAGSRSNARDTGAGPRARGRLRHLGPGDPQGAPVLEDRAVGATAARAEEGGSEAGARGEEGGRRRRLTPRICDRLVGGRRASSRPWRWPRRARNESAQAAHRSGSTSRRCGYGHLSCGSPCCGLDPAPFVPPLLLLVVVFGKRLRREVVDEAMPLLELRPQVLRELLVRHLACRGLACLAGARCMRHEPQPHVPPERLGQQLEIAMVARHVPTDMIEPTQEQLRIALVAEMLLQRVFDDGAFGDPACCAILRKLVAQFDGKPRADSNTSNFGLGHGYSLPLHGACEREALKRRPAVASDRGPCPGHGS